jgi:hypothetical protein
MILAFAGRRVDAVNAAVPRFPLANVPLVRGRIRKLLEEHAPYAVVSSAACGVDLIALSEASALGVRRQIVLPFSRGRFRSTSVTDRPGEWGGLFDEVLNDADATGAVLELKEGPDDNAYLVVNRTILDVVATLMNARHQPARAVLVWDGASSGEQDVTEQFGIEARRRGLALIELPTL